MKSFSYVISDPEGIHARPAGALVKAAKSVTSSVKIVANGKTGDCKKVFAIMSLGVKKGTEITVNVEGEDEDVAVEAMKVALQDNNL